MISLVVSSSFGRLSCAIYRQSHQLYAYGPVKLFDSNVATTVQEGLKDLGITAKDLGRLVVDTGPGGTSSVRTAVAFLNGLSYSLDLPIHAVTSLEALCHQAVVAADNGPAVAIANSLGKTLYYGYYADGGFILKHGDYSEFWDDVSHHGLRQLCGDASLSEKLVQQSENEKVGLRIAGVVLVNPTALLQLADNKPGQRFPELPVPAAELMG